jgi:DNA-binding CsgD family transcriptional regulator
LGVDDFIARATRSLRRVVSADRCSYNEMHPERGFIRLVFEPQGGPASRPLLETLERYAHQNPILVYYRRTGRPRVGTFSDFLSSSRFHRLPLYAEYYRHVGIEHQIIVPLALRASPAAREIGFALNRQGRDFSSRDRLILELLQPHLIQAHANVRAVEREREWRTGLEGALETDDRSAVLLDGGARACFMSRRSRELLVTYFGGNGLGDRLPEPVACWVKAQDEALGADGGVPPARRPLVRERDGKRLTVRFVGCVERRMLLLEERSLTLDPRALAPLGLTRRESEVLAWLSGGKTNEEIGVVLGMRPATVAKHLEHIYQRLSVETRTAAAALALAVAGLPAGFAP